VPIMHVSGAHRDEISYLKKFSVITSASLFQYRCPPKALFTPACGRRQFNVAWELQVSVGDHNDAWRECRWIEPTARGVSPGELDRCRCGLQGISHRCRSA
jgi:hypothetical protein